MKKVITFLVPNYFTSDGGWDRIWQGYNPGPVPEDVDLADFGRISEGEARLKYTLDGRMQQTGAKTGMHVFVRGHIWDLSSYGHTIIFTENGTIEASPDTRGAVINYWLPQRNKNKYKNLNVHAAAIACHLGLASSGCKRAEHG